MSLLTAKIEGSVCSPENYKLLQRARFYLQRPKEEKLRARHEKNERLRHKGIAYAPNVFNHIVEETKELKAALANDDFENAIEEIADVINCAEILAAILIENRI